METRHDSCRQKRSAAICVAKFNQAEIEACYRSVGKCFFDVMTHA